MRKTASSGGKRTTPRRSSEIFVAVVWTGEEPHRDDNSMSCWVGPKEEVRETAVRFCARWNRAPGSEAGRPGMKRYVVLLGKLSEVHEIVPPKPKPDIRVKVTALKSLEKLTPKVAALLHTSPILLRSAGERPVSHRSARFNGDFY